MSDAWTYDDEHRCWIHRREHARVYLMPRPHYCDRGHWYAVVDGIGNLDDADAFPRFYMDLDRAKQELAEWLAWRLEENGPPSIVDIKRAKSLAVDLLMLAIQNLASRDLLATEEGSTLLSVVASLQQRHGNAT